MESFFEDITQSQLLAIVEAARIALADADIASKIGENMDLSDAEINHLQHKCHEIMKENN